MVSGIFVNNIESVLKSGTLNADLISDHKLVFCELNIKTVSSEEKVITYRDFKNIDVIKLKQDLAAAGLEEMLHITD
ncbi:unnamed protein product [Acanthoscelides obtectus]|uniref:Uncharacterized protein n=1 Tax=Acanthoscelides obtectus TaxID=200917 RepID=A0A9P0M619_ACAOB|nr:unnamed protein product [Acanthoscelides obtectus]CAK1627571.1 hypothetical protein AOBTE_LOCUS4670 [Acanthoscelides obtectus]